jgi:hypothetical protein
MTRASSESPPPDDPAPRRGPLQSLFDSLAMPRAKSTTTAPDSSAEAMTDTATASPATAAEQQPPVLTLDGTAYAFDALSERARLLSVDFVRTDQEWMALQHRYRQFVAMEATVVNHLKEEVEKSEMEPVWTSGNPSESEQPLLTIDDKSYDATKIPDNVRLYVEDLVRNNQERGQLEFRLRQLDAARTAYLGAIREELESSGTQPLDPQPEAPAEAEAA